MAKAKVETTPGADAEAVEAVAEETADAFGAKTDNGFPKPGAETVNEALGSEVADARMRAPDEGSGEDSRRRNAMVRVALRKLGVPETYWDEAIAVLGGVDLETLEGKAAVVAFAESKGFVANVDGAE